MEIYKQLEADDSRTAIRKLGDCYRMMNDLESARHYYKLAVEQENIAATYYLYYAQSLMNSGDYAAAKTWFETYRTHEPDSRLADRMIEACDRALENSITQTPFELISLDLNSAVSDFGPAFYQNGILFTSSRMESIIRKKDTWTNAGYLDVYYVPVTWQEDTVYSVEKLRGSVNTFSYHDGPASVNREEDRIYFTRNNVLAGDAQTSRTGEIKLKIYAAERSGEGFKNVVELDFNGNEYSCAYPSVNYNESVIYYASDKAGGYGGTDIYYSTYDPGKARWSKPVNAGEHVNTEGDERFPFIHEDGTLYFASNGHLGYGGLDIYAASPVTTGSLEYVAVRNLGKPFNSERDDFSFIIDPAGVSGFMASNRPGGRGDDDIYRFTSATTPISIFTQSGDSTLANVWITLYDINRRLNLQRGATRPDGEFSGRMQPNTQYMIIAQKKGYITVKKPWQTNDSNEPVQLTIELKRSE
jgi:tetratricopeptide (TPR) repeat protein